MRYSGWYAAAIVLAGYTLVIGRSSIYSLGDLPNHTARCTVMADLIFHHGARFGGDFQYRFMAVPYVLGDLVLSSLVELFGPTLAAGIWSTVTFLSLPASVVLYLRVVRATERNQLLGLLVATYLSTGWSFFAGFIEFRIAVSVTLVALALVELLRRRRSMGMFWLYAAVVVAGYLIHLTALVFLTAALVSSAALRLWLRRSDFKNEALLLAPLAVMLLWHFGIAPHFSPPDDSAGNAMDWGTVGGKLARIPWEFRRFGGHIDTIPKILFVVFIGAILYGKRFKDALATPAVVEMLALSVTFLALYFALPVRTNDALYIDIRALVPAVLFLVMGLLALPVPNDEHPRSMAAAALPAAFLIALSNLAIIAAHFAAESAWIAGYRQIVASIPAGSRVLPVTPKLATPFTHAGSAVVIDTGGVIPYLFSGDVGNPMKHFRYIHRPYAPAEGWYGQHAASVDWGQIGCAYEYLLLIKPYDPARVGVATSPVAENSSAALVKLDPHACRRSQAQGI